MTIQNLNLKVSIDPIGESIEVNGKFTLKNSTNSLSVYLNKSLKWKKLFIYNNEEKLLLNMEEVDNDHSFLKTAKKYILSSPNDKSFTDIHFSYEGKITIDEWGTNYIKKDAIELALYAIWYPIHNIEDKPNFTIKMAELKNWQCLSNGKQISDNTWITNNRPIDIILLGLPKNTWKATELFWGRESDYESTFKALEYNLISRKSYLEKLLGSCNKDSFTFAFMPRNSGGIYVRDNLVITQYNYPSELNKNNLLFSWTHELSHLWFNKISADNWHNWIDEALAEYSALLVSKEVVSDEFFQNKIEKRREYIKKQDLPPIYELNRGSQYAQACFYIWGSLIIDKICNEIGLDNFKKFLNKFAQFEITNNNITTENLIEVLKSVNDQDWNKKLYVLLKAKPDIELL